MNWRRCKKTVAAGPNTGGRSWSKSRMRFLREPTPEMCVRLRACRHRTGETATAPVHHLSAGFLLSAAVERPMGGVAGSP